MAILNGTLCHTRDLYFRGKTLIMVYKIHRARLAGWVWHHTHCCNMHLWAEAKHSSLAGANLAIFSLDTGREGGVGWIQWCNRQWKSVISNNNEVIWTLQWKSCNVLIIIIIGWLSGCWSRRSTHANSGHTSVTIRIHTLHTHMARRCVCVCLSICLSCEGLWSARHQIGGKLINM